MSSYHCLLCCKLVDNTNDKIDEGGGELENEKRPEVKVSLLCKTLQVTSAAFTPEEYGDFIAPVCVECNKNLEKINLLLEELENIGKDLARLRKSIKSQLGESLQNSEDIDEYEYDVHGFETIRLKIFTDLAKISPDEVQIPKPPVINLKEEPYDSDYNNVAESLSETIATNDCHKKISLSSKQVKSKQSKDSKTIKVKKSNTKIKAFTSKSKNKHCSNVRERIYKLKKSVNRHRKSDNEGTVFKTNVSISRSGRLRRSTVKPDFLYKDKKEQIFEHEFSDEGNDSYVDPNIKIKAECSADFLKLVGDELDNDRGQEIKDVPKLSLHPNDSEEIPEDKRKGKKRNGVKMKIRNYKHIIDPQLTLDQIKLIGSNKKLILSADSHVIVGENGKASINMSNIMNDESIAVVKIQDQLFGKRFGCNFKGCKKSFPDKETRDVHFKRKHDGSQFPHECELCKKTFRQRRTLMRHAESHCQHDGNNKLERPVKKRKLQVKLKTHLCQFCPEKWRSPSELQIHLRKAHTGETPYQCKYCDKSFISTLRLEFHVEQNHDEVAPFKCEFCAKGFFREHRLKSHSVVHTGERPFLCEICSKSFAFKSQLNFHQAIHNEQLAHRYKCQECNKFFASPYNLKAHRTTVHEKSYRYICEICDHGSAQMSTHRVHMRKHTGELPYCCPFCEKGYKTGAALNIHQRKHTGERPYVCKTCGKGFAARSRLLRHELIHKEERPYQCTICNKGFTTISYLNGHCKTSHKYQIEVVPDEQSFIVDEEYQIINTDNE